MSMTDAELQTLENLGHGDAANEIRELRAEVERLLGITNTPHFKPRSRTDLKYLSHDELASDVIRFEQKYLHRSSMYFHLDQSYEKQRAELSASREREARMREAVRGLLDALPSATTHPAIKAARAALAEGSQG